MAIQVRLDLLQGASASHHVTSGWAITRLAIVTDIPESPTQTTGSLYEIALAAIIAVVGDRGDPCPDIPVPTYLEQFVPEVISPQEVRVRIIYKGYPLATYEFNTSLDEVESNLDADGHVIYTKYTYPANYSPDPNGRHGVEHTQGGLITRGIPIIGFTVKTIITGTGDQDATYAVSLLAEFVGRVNNQVYGIGAIIGAARTWKVSAVSATSRDGGVSYEFSMSFQYRADTWDRLITFINPDDGHPPNDLIAGVGSKTVKIPYDSALPTFTFGPN